MTVNTMHPEGTLVKTSGYEFVITGYKSGVNYTATRISDGKKFLLRRSGNMEVLGHDASKIPAARVIPFLTDGAIVRTMGSGKYGNKIGVVSRANGTRAQVVVPNFATISCPMSQLEITDTAALIASLR